MRLRRVVIDTNVFISAFLFGGIPARVIGYVVDGSVECAISLPILDEIRDVLQRRKFGLSARQALAFVEEIHALCRLVSPSETIRGVVSTDPDDHKVLECAFEAQADLIISGDSDLLDLTCWRDIQILAAADFVRVMEEGARHGE